MAPGELHLSQTADSSQETPFGPYVMGHRIASGGMGEIYSAARVGLGNFRKPVALKLLLEHLAEEEHVVQMFLGEALIAARMNHPNVVQVYDAGLESGRYYIAMELIRGVAMWTFIGAMARKGLHLPAPLICYIGRQLCEGLHYAHELCDEQGRPLSVIHRDVTPANILLTDDGRAKLTDFGIAKARDVVTKTYPGTVKGTLEYLSPEQASGGRVDRRVDIYCAGVTLFHLATYQSPFWKGNDLGTIQAIQHEPLPSLSTLRPDLPPALGQALSIATYKDPNGRYATARDFREAIPAPPDHEACAEELASLVRELAGLPALARPKPSPTAPVELADSADRTMKVQVQAPRDAAHTHLANALPPQQRLARIRSAVWILSAGLLGAAGAAAFLHYDPFGLAGDVIELVGETELRGEEEAALTELSKEGLAPDEAGDDDGEGPELAEAVAAPNDAPAEPAPEPAALANAALETAAENAPPKRTEVRRRSRSRARYGYLTVHSSRPATVFVAGKKLGTTPLTRRRVSTGRLTVVVRSNTGRVQKHVLRVSPGKLSALKATFR